MPRTQILAPILALSAAALLVGAASTPSPGKQAAIEPDPALQIARQLDGIAQTRFANTRLTVFGTGRIVQPTMARHNFTSIVAENAAEAATLEGINAAHRNYMVAFLHCAPVPGASPAPMMPVVTNPLAVGRAALSPMATAPVVIVPSAKDLVTPLNAPMHPYLTTLIVHSGDMSATAPVSVAPIPPSVAAAQPALQSEALSSLTKLKQGEKVQTTSGEWTMLLCPVVASNETCLSCHVTAKRGDTLGVMAYAVNKTAHRN